MPIPMRSQSHREREGQVFLVADGNQTELNEYLNSPNCYELLGSEAYVDNEGHIFYRTWRSLPRQSMLPPKHTIISHLHRAADIFAPHTRYQEWHDLVAHQVTKDGGTVEVAIRNMDHILEGTRGRESQRVEVASSRAHELFDLFSRDFAAITPEEFAAARQKTYNLLRSVNLDPDQIVSQELQRLAFYLLKGSSGHDATGRENMIISVGALSAAYRLAVERRWGLGEITSKFVQMREALLITRNFDRDMFLSVADRLALRAMPALAMFKDPEAPAYDLGYAVGVLGTLRFQLEQTHVLPYRQAATELIPQVTEIQDLLVTDDRRSILERSLLETVYTSAVQTLEDHKDIYPR